MTKTVTMNYGALSIPSNRIPTNVSIELFASPSGGLQSRDFVPYGTPSFDLSVPAGTWFVRVTNLAQDGVISVIESAPFDVVESVTVTVVTGVSI